MPTCAGMTRLEPSVGQSFRGLVVRRETDKEQEVQVLYGEDIASHAGPAPCVVFREGQGEALAGERAGWPLSRVNALSRVPTGLPTWKATRAATLPRAAVRSGVVRDPSMHRRSLPGNREISLLTGGVAHRRPAWGRPKGRSLR
jgi:hypothetical protein